MNKEYIQRLLVGQYVRCFKYGDKFPYVFEIYYQKLYFVFAMGGFRFLETSIHGPTNWRVF